MTDLEKARTHLLECPRNYTIYEIIAYAMSAERASIPESVKKALIGALEFYDNHCSAEDEECELKAMSTKQIQKAIADLDEWLKG